MTHVRGGDAPGSRPAGRRPAVGVAAACLVAAVLMTTGCATSPASPAEPTVRAEVRTAPEPSSAAVVIEPSPSPSALVLPPGPVVMAASVPLALQIPAIAVDTGLLQLGLLADGSMEVPPDGASAGWYDGAPTPGELGPAVIAGHVDWVTGPGVFYDLAGLAAGDEVRVTRTDGTVAVFVVTAVEEYAKDEFPTDRVYGDIDHAGLRLITCGGSWNAETRHYESNTVVFAELAPPGSP